MFLQFTSNERLYLLRISLFGSSRRGLVRRVGTTSTRRRLVLIDALGRRLGPALALVQSLVGGLASL